MNSNKTFCEECRKDVEYRVETAIINGKLKGKEYEYTGKKAVCKECGNEVYVADIEDENLKALYDTLERENMNKDMYSALEIARYTVAHCLKSKIPIDYLQLPKIMYYMQGYFLAVFGKPLFNDPIYAWKSGPIIVEVHNKYSYFGADPIYTDDVSVDLEKLTPEENKLIDAVIENKVLKSAWQLMTEIHSEMPWRSTKQYEVIDNSKIQKFFYNYLNRQYLFKRVV